MLHVHRSERTDGLVDALAELLARPLADPMQAEVVAVPTRGIERWLSQMLAGRLGATSGRQDGVCANVDFPFPAKLIGAALASASGVDPDSDPWPAARSVWPLLEVVDASLGEPWLAPLTAHLNRLAPEGEDRRFSVVRHVADLYDRYAVHRPALVREWASGNMSLRSDASWQALLWRRLRHHIGTPSFAERLPPACDALAAKPDLLEAPQRLSIFGLTRLPASYVEVLSALARGRDVHLFLLHPSPALWERISEIGKDGTEVLRRRDGRPAELVRNPLLESWGRDSREMQLVLASTPVEDRHHPVEPGGGNLLALIQNGVRNDAAPPDDPNERPLLDPGDRSVRIHDCHGKARQVEVIRDDLCHLLDENPALELRDVIVMCPDIEAYAPLVRAVFGAAEADGDGHREGSPPALKVRLADRSLRQTNPMLDVLAKFLDLASSRVTASQVLDLASQEPVRRRFKLEDADLERLASWATGAGVRWGIDAAQRAPFKLTAVGTGTWRAGIDRTLLGVAMADEHQRMFEGIVPLDDVDSTDIVLAGKMAELLHRLSSRVISAFSGSRTVGGWANAIAEAADQLCSVTEQDAWQRLELDRMLQEISEEASGSSVMLTLADVQALLADRLKGRPTRANFRTGHLTICTLVPMRSVPHRVVCLLGLDDGVFPRSLTRDGDDLMLDEPRVGDQDTRSEDRQLLLDALLAATDHLVITYAGRDERTNLPRPPAVPVGELIDLIDRSVRTRSGSPAREQVVVRHPLQPFDERNFCPGLLGTTGPFRYDEVNLDGARALELQPSQPGPFLEGPLPDLDTTIVELTDLEQFVRHPVRSFLRRRLWLDVRDWTTELIDSIPVDLSGLERWQVGERLLAARLEGDPPEACLAAERARGHLPPGQLAEPLLTGISHDVEALVAVCERDGSEPQSLYVNTVLPDGTQIVGTVPGVRGETLLQVSFSKLKPDIRLVSWLHLLAVCAAWPERPFRALTVGRAREDAKAGRQLSVARIEPIGETAAGRRQAAAHCLAILLDLFRRGMSEPLPIYSATSAAWASERTHNRSSREGAALRQWTTGGGFDREDREPEHRMVLGGEVPFRDLLAAAPRADEGGAGWAEDEDTRLGRFARRLWDPVLDREELEDR